MFSPLPLITPPTVNAVKESFSYCCFVPQATHNALNSQQPLDQARLLQRNAMTLKTENMRPSMTFCSRQVGWRWLYTF